jgi:hypothetical protein
MFLFDENTFAKIEILFGKTSPKNILISKLFFLIK